LAINLSDVALNKNLKLKMKILDRENID